MTTRREFLKQTVIVAAGTIMLPGTFNILSKDKPKVIISGAGFAGLSAGYKLSNAGYDVTILEARNRIGGRVFSHVIDELSGLVVELGAEWVGASHQRIIEMCKDFGLELQNNQFDSRLLYRNEFYEKDKWSFSTEWKTKFNKLIEQYHTSDETFKKKLDRMDWWRYLMNNGIPERDMEIRELMDSTDFGESIRFVSAYAAIAEYAESSERNEMDFKIKGGNSQLAKKLADKIGEQNIKLKHKASVISQSDGAVKVECENGKSFTADKLICAVPTFSISKINWKPELPEDKINAINELQYARICKNAVLYSDRFWKDESFDMVTDIYGHYFYHATKNQGKDRNTNKGVLISYTTGDKADVIYRQKDDFKKDVMNKCLSPGFGDIKNKIEKQVTYYWGMDEYSKGAYALYGKGQWFTLQPILKNRFMNTHFAGEHLADWQGFMEGAINSGEEAADEIMS